MRTRGLVISNISDQIVDLLRRAIVAGEFPPGTPLRENELAEKFEVSRHPVRKALQQLTLEGVLEAKPNCGVTVAAESTEHVAPLLIPMRVQLELYALQRLTPEILKEQRSEWNKILRQMREAADEKDEQSLLSLDADFHQRLLIAAGMKDHIPLWLAIYGRMRGYYLLAERQLENLSFVPFLHEKLLESFLGNDREQAKRNLQSHLENTEFNQNAHAVWKKQQRKGARP